jgi:hypothetical protein
MKTWILCVLLLPSLVAAEDAKRSLHRFDPFVVGTLLSSEINYGCGCGFYYPPAKKGEGFLLTQWELGEPASMFVDGQLIKLNVEEGASSATRIGEKEVFSLHSPVLSAKASLTCSWVCPVGQESCEVTEYVGTLHLASKRGRTSIPVWASCGC